MISNAAIILILSCFWKRNATSFIFKIYVYIHIYMCVYIYIYAGNEWKDEKYIFLRDC